jgi:hypothetical protein
MQAVGGHDVALDLGSRRVRDHKARKHVPGDQQIQQSIVPRLQNQDAQSKFAYRAALDRHPAVPVVDHPIITDLIVGAVFGQLAIAVDPVAVEIEGDVVSANHDPVVWAVDQVAVQRRVGGDGVAAAHVACQRRTSAKHREASHHQHQD